MKIELTPRLASALSHVRMQSRVADIGTDHAYLPIALVQKGIPAFVYASDIADGPVERAKENIRKYGLEKEIVVEKADGLLGAERYAPTDILILGMGGELIVKILTSAPFVKKRGIRLILQPMTHPELVAAYLLENGFAVTESAPAEEILPGTAETGRSRFYRILAADYTGRAEQVDFSDPETFASLLVGDPILSRAAERERRMRQLSAQIAVYEAIRTGKEKSGKENAEFERQVISYLEARKEKV